MTKTIPIPAPSNNWLNGFKDKKETFLAPVTFEKSHIDKNGNVVFHYNPNLSKERNAELLHQLELKAGIAFGKKDRQ